MPSCLIIALIVAFALTPDAAPGETPLGEPVSAGTDTEQALHAPAERDEFSFVILGDRTGGPDEGIAILEEAVRMANRLGPAFVMTVGDLIQGYNTDEQWIAQAEEYKQVMTDLRMPWYPVAGNHDVYARPEKEGGHTGLYKQHFGPLYYSFDYHWAHFVCLFSDEKLSYANPAEDQNVGPEQMAWLRDDLASTDATQVFVFLHHPRWNYQGCNWDDVHRLFTEDGRVRAVFAGHWHEYRDEGVRDGIHYYVLAITGGQATSLAPGASFDHINHVRVRRDAVDMAVLPVGSVLPGDVVLGSEAEEMHRLGQGDWLRVRGEVALDVDEQRSSTVTVLLHNPTAMPMPYEVSLDVPESWQLTHEPLQGTIDPGDTASLPIGVRTAAFDGAERSIGRIEATIIYQTAAGRTHPVSALADVPLALPNLDAFAGAAPDDNKNWVLQLDGDDAVRLDVSRDLLDVHAFTLECWVRGSEPTGRVAFLTKTEGSSFGMFWCNEGANQTTPTGYVNLAGHGYIWAQTSTSWRWDQWTHIALTYDGAALRVFVNGEVTAETEHAGSITRNHFPLYVGADPGPRGEPTSFFTGAIDEVRLSDVVRYEEPFQPARIHRRDAHTIVLLHFDAQAYGLHPDDSGRSNHGWPIGEPVLHPEAR